MIFALLFACASEPTWVSRDDLEHAAAKGDAPILCAGLKMKDDGTRLQAAQWFKDFGGDTSCVCTRIVREGRWDEKILTGLSGADNAEKLACVGDVLDDAALPDRPGLVRALSKLPVARPRLQKAALEDADKAVRLAAWAAFRGVKDPATLDLLVTRLGSTTDAEERAAIVGALYGQAKAEATLRKVLAEDADPATRAAALTSLQALDLSDRSALLCAGVRDAEPSVRARAVAALRATRNPEQLACLRERMLVPEPDADVRVALLDAVGASPAPEAAKALCDAAPVWVATFVTAKEVAPSDDILKAQNDRDHENTYECATAALRQPGLSCWAKSYAAGHVVAMGGRVSIPRCEPQGASPGGGGGKEVSFE